MFFLLADACAHAEALQEVIVSDHLTGFVVFVSSVSIAVAFIRKNVCRIAVDLAVFWYRARYIALLWIRGLIYCDENVRSKLVAFRAANKRALTSIWRSLYLKSTANTFWRMYEQMVFVVLLVVIVSYASGPFLRWEWCCVVLPICFSLLLFLGVSCFLFFIIPFRPLSRRELFRMRWSNPSFKKKLCSSEPTNDLPVGHISWYAVAGEKNSIRAFCSGCAYDCTHNFIVYSDGNSLITFNLGNQGHKNCVRVIPESFLHYEVHITENLC